MANNNEDNREVLKQPLTPKKRKSLDKVTDWVSQNGMIILVVSLIIILLMSASRPLGWLSVVIGIILIYIFAQTQPEEQESEFNKKLSTHIDSVGLRMSNNIEERVASPHNPSPQRKKIDDQVGGLNLNLLVISMAAITLILAFYGPFASAYIFGIESKTSIFQTSLIVAQLSMNARIISYGFLTIVIGAPIAIILLTLSKRKNTNVWAMIISIIESLVLVIVTVSLVYLMSTIEEGRLVSIFSAKLVDIIDMTVGFGISSYLILLSSVVTSITTVLNKMK